MKQPRLTLVSAHSRGTVRLCAALGLLLVLAALLPTSARASGPRKRHALVLHSYHYGNAWTQDVMKGIEAVLGGLKRVNVSVEFMDTKRRTGAAYLQRLRHAYESKYGGVKLDVILSCDDSALAFLLVYRDVLFPGVPIVFCGVNDLRDSMLAGHSGITGVVEAPDIRGTLDLALRLHPQARQVAVIGDQTPTGLANLRRLERVLPRYKGKVAFKHLTNLSAAELRQALQELPADSIVLYLTFSTDREGAALTLDESMALVSENCRVPLYGCWELLVGRGAIGGSVISGVDQGRAAAEMARRILLGARPDAIPVLRASPTVRLFDYEQLRRFGLRPAALPEGSVVVNQPAGLSARHWWLIWGTMVFLAAETLLIALLLLNRARRRKVQEQLHRNQERLHALLEGIDDALFVHDEEGNILYCNKAACRRLGYSQAELLRMNTRNIDAPSFAQGFPERLRHQLADGQHSCEGIHLAKNGRRIPVDINTSVVEYDGRRAVLALARDITQRKQVEQALRDSEGRFRQLAETIDQVFWFMTVRPERMLYVSPAFERIWGHAPEDLYRDAGLWLKAVHPDDQPGIRAAFEACIRGESPQFRAEYRIVCPDGSVRWILDEGAPIRNERGELYRLSGIAKDITARKRAEQALRESEERLALGLAGADLGMWDRDVRTGDAVYNERWAEMLGYALAEIEPHTRAWQQLVHPDDFPRVRQELDAHIEGRTPVYEAEYRMRTKGGGWKWILARGRVVERDENGLPLRITGTHLDITARKQAEEEHRTLEAQIQHAQKLESLGVLAGGIAHDFNNLLVAILGNADLALGELSPASPARDSLAEIETAARRAADLCRQMLAYSGRGQFLIAPVDLNDIVSEMTHLLEVSISKKVAVKYALAPDLPTIEADATQIRQIIMNLITNASEAIGDESGGITVSTGVMDCDRAYLSSTYLDEELSEGSYVYLEVADTGCGMDAQTQQSMFDPFFTTKFTGRGLGLAAAIGIVRGHHGAIKVYSEPGRGTTFKVLFPPSHTRAASQEPQQQEAEPWRGTGTVLLVDDEETVRVVGQRMLELAGFAVLTAADGRQAITLFRQHLDKIVCVLLDLTMPHMDGEEAFRELRRIRSDIRVILSSGYGEQEVTSRFAGKGLAGFIQKPYRSSALAAKLREVLEGDAGQA